MNKPLVALIPVTISLSMACPVMAQIHLSHGEAVNSTGARPVAVGDDEFRPTNFLGVERAQVLDDDAVVMTLNVPNVSKGMGNLLEVGLGAGLMLNTTPFLALPITAYGKKVINQSGNMTVGVGARASLGVLSFGPVATGSVAPLPISLTGFLPISFWKLGPGDLTLMPQIQAGTNGFNVGTAVAYEYPLMAKWTLDVSDTILAGPSGGNALSLGARVALAPNLTADLGTISLTGTSLTLNLVSISGSFGGRFSEVRSAWGL